MQSKQAPTPKPSQGEASQQKSASQDAPNDSKEVEQEIWDKDFAQVKSGSWDSVMGKDDDDKDDKKSGKSSKGQDQMMENMNPLSKASSPADSASGPSPSMMSQSGGGSGGGGFDQVSQMFNGGNVDPNQVAQFVAENPEVLAL